ncbi:MAG: bacterial Ig-like domain-containing protein, partial [Oscillospiraceae bacterium]|nr:bacterial Ig-like domain-containing protein [Oscillospiraceae bacterium]
MSFVLFPAGFFSLSAPPDGGGAVLWQPSQGGPFSGAVTCLAKSDGVLFAGTFRGLYKSVNSGYEWIPACGGASLAHANITALASDGNKIYVGTENYGIFVSENNGLNFKRLAARIPDITSVIAKGDKIFAASKNNGLYGSYDGGDTFRRYNSGLSNANISVMAAIDGGIAAGTVKHEADGDKGGIYFFNEDSGRWAKNNSGLGKSDREVYSLTVKDGTLYAGISDCLYKLKGSENLWEPVNENFTAKILYSYGGGIFALRADKDSFGLFMSYDNGVNFSVSGADGAVPFKTAYSMLADGGNLYIGGREGFFMSPDRGASFINSNGGLRDADISGLKTAPGGVFALSDGELLFSDNKCKSFIPVSSGLDTAILNFGVYEKTVFAADHETVYKTRNMGKTWEKLSPAGLPGNSVHNFIFSPDGKIYTVTFSYKTPDAYITGGGTAALDFSAFYKVYVYVSEDSGQKFKKLSADFEDSMFINLFAAGEKIFISNTIFGLDISGLAENELYVLEKNKFIKASAGFNEGEIINTVVASGEIYILGTDRGLYFSEDGKSFAKTRDGLPGIRQNIKAIEAKNGAIYVSADCTIADSEDIDGENKETEIKSGVFALYGGEENFASVGNGLPESTVNIMAADDDFLYAAVRGNSVWQLRLYETELTGITAAPPAKTVYADGDCADMSGLAVTASYADGSSFKVTGYALSLESGDVISGAGIKTVTVSFSDGNIT